MVEYAIVLAAVAVGIMVMARMVQGTIQGSYRKSADTLGFGQQYTANGTTETLRGFVFYGNTTGNSTP